MNKILLSFALIALSSCQNKEQEIGSSQVEKLLEENPKQALAYLMKEKSKWLTKDSMLYYLELADAQNKSFVKISSSQALEKATKYFVQQKDTYNIVRSWYLLGCFYRDKGDYPQATNSYQTAISYVTDQHVDSKMAKLLTHIYGQMLDVLDDCVLPKQMLWAANKMEKYSMIAKDTLSTGLAWESRAQAYGYLHKSDSAIIALNIALSIYKNQNQKYATVCYSLLLPYYLDRGNLMAAKKCIAYFEANSKSIGERNLGENEHDIYYYDKGKFYIAVNQLDSAEQCFRLVLRNKQDNNCQEAGLHGLYLLYKQKNNKDSLAKYAELAYQMNDKRILDLSTNEVQRMQLFYNYTRHKRLAHKAKLKVKHSKMIIWIIGTVFTLLISTLTTVFYLCIKAKKATLEKYERKTRELTQEVLTLQKRDDTSIKRAIDEEMQSTPICQKFHKAGFGYDTVISEDWKELEHTLYDKYPYFKNLMESHRSLIGDDEFKISLLVRLSFKPSEISNLLDIKSSTVSMKRERLVYKLFKVKGKAKELDDRLKKLY